MIETSSESETEADDEEDSAANVSNSLNESSAFNLSDELNLAGRNGNEDDNKSEKLNLHLYTFVVRCIAYNLNIDYEKKLFNFSPKIFVETFETIRKDFVNYLATGHDLVLGDSVYHLNKKFFTEVMCDDRIEQIVRTRGVNYDIFYNIYLKFLEHEIARSSISEEETMFIMASFTLRWKAAGGEIAHFNDAERLSKEELAELFRKILGVNESEAVTIQNACQVDNEDEQLACLKRELNAQANRLHETVKTKNFFHKFMEKTYIDESLERLQSMGAGIEQINDVIIKNLPIKYMDLRFVDDVRKRLGKKKRILSRRSVVLTKKMFAKVFQDTKFVIKLTVHEVTGMEALGDHEIFVVMHLGGRMDQDYQTDVTLARRPFFDSEAVWTVAYPYTYLKLTVMGVRTSRFKLEHETALVECVIEIHAGTNVRNKWIQMIEVEHKRHHIIKSKYHFASRIKVSYEMDNHESIKKAGYLKSFGKNNWQTRKQRLFMVVKIMDFDMALCTFVKNALIPKHHILLSTYIVDFTERPEEYPAEKCFKLAKTGDQIHFSCSTESEQLSWIRVLYLATGQSVKPYGIDDWYMLSSNDAVQKRKRKELQEAFKQGLANVIQAEPINFDQEKLYTILLKETMTYQTKEYFTLGRLSSNQEFLLRCYCRRYNIHGICVKLQKLKQLIRLAIEGYYVDSYYIRSIYNYLANEMCGRGHGDAFTTRQYNEFAALHQPLFQYIKHSVINFRQLFPFGQIKVKLDVDREEDLFAHIIILMRDMFHYSPGSDSLDDRGDNFQRTTKSLFKEAALRTYNNISKDAKILDCDEVPFAEKLEIIIIILDNCMRLTNEIQNYFTQVPIGLMEMFQIYIFDLLAYDIEHLMRSEDKESWISLLLYEKVRTCVQRNSLLQRQNFDFRMRSLYTPVLLKNIDIMENDVLLSIDYVHKSHQISCSIERCEVAHEAVSSHLRTSFRDFKEYLGGIRRLWSKMLMEHLEHRLKSFASYTIEIFMRRM